MSVLIVRNNKTVAYNMKKPLEKQVKGCVEIRVRKGAGDPTVEHFFDQVERMCQSGQALNVAIKLVANPSCELSINDIINKMVNSHNDADRRLGELSSMMTRKKE